jgi:CheY-like chemotaxis protein
MKKKILIVEDDPDIRLNLKLLLEGEDYSVDVAENGRVALERLSHGELPSLIILDLMMPVMDGFKFRELQQQDRRIASIPIMIMTADAHVTAKQTSIGAKAAVKKPTDALSILEMVDGLVSRAN